MNRMGNETGKTCARKLQVWMAVLMIPFTWGSSGAVFQAATIADKGLVTKSFRQPWRAGPFPGGREKDGYPVNEGPLNGTKVRELMVSSLRPLMNLSGRRNFCHRMVARLLRGNLAAEGELAMPEMTVSGRKGQKFRDHYAQTDFHPHRNGSIAHRFAALASAHRQQHELLVLGEVVLHEIESNPDFRQNNLTSAVTLAMGTAIEIERGQSLDEGELSILLESIHQLLTQNRGLMEQPAENLTTIYDTCLLVSGLMIAFHGDACTYGHLELAVAARQLARFMLEIIGWPDENLSRMTRLPGSEIQTILKFGQ